MKSVGSVILVTENYLGAITVHEIQSGHLTTGCELTCPKTLQSIKWRELLFTNLLAQ